MFLPHMQSVAGTQAELGSAPARIGSQLLVYEHVCHSQRLEMTM